VSSQYALPQGKLGDTVPLCAVEGAAVADAAAIVVVTVDVGRAQRDISRASDALHSGRQQRPLARALVRDPLPFLLLNLQARVQLGVRVAHDLASFRQRVLGHAVERRQQPDDPLVADFVDDEVRRRVGAEEHGDVLDRAAREDHRQDPPRLRGEVAGEPVAQHRRLELRTAALVCCGESFGALLVLRRRDG
jgi:hypothetical protein